MTRSIEAFTAPSRALFIVAAVCLAGCDQTSPSATSLEGPSMTAKPSCPGHPSCQDPTAPAGDGTVDLTGDMITASTQPVIISRDSKNWFEGSGGGFDNTIENQLSLFVSAGSPTPASVALGGCTTSPDGLPDATVQRLIDRLNDDLQIRTFRFKVDKRDPSNWTGTLVNSWTDDGDGHRYRTWVIGDPAVTTPSQDVYLYSGGTIRSWDTSTDEHLDCPSSGSVTVTVVR